MACWQDVLENAPDRIARAARKARGYRGEEYPAVSVSLEGLTNPDTGRALSVGMLSSPDSYCYDINSRLKHIEQSLADNDVVAGMEYYLWPAIRPFSEEKYYEILDKLGRVGRGKLIMPGSFPVVAANKLTNRAPVLYDGSLIAQTVKYGDGGDSARALSYWMDLKAGHGPRNFNAFGLRWKLGLCCDAVLLEQLELTDVSVLLCYGNWSFHSWKHVRQGGHLIVVDGNYNSRYAIRNSPDAVPAGLLSEHLSSMWLQNPKDS